MRIIRITCLEGPNVFTSEPALRMELDLEGLAGASSATLDGFTDRLLAALPGLAVHEPSWGIVERLREGIGLSEIVGPVWIELCRLTGLEIAVPQLERASRAGLVHVVVPYSEHLDRNEDVTHALLTASVHLIDAVANARPFDLQARVARVVELARDTRTEIGARATIEAAERRGIPWSRVGRDGLLMLGHGRRRRFLQAASAFALRLGEKLADDQSRAIGNAVVEGLFPGSASARIPIVSVAGWHGKTSLVGMLTHALDGSGHVVGTASSEGLSVGRELLVSGPSADHESARALLADANVEVAVLETSDDSIERSGLGYDWADVAVITNAADGNCSDSELDRLVRLKSVVASRVRDGGTLVLNADDSRLGRLARCPRVCPPGRRVVLCSLFAHSDAVLEHTRANETAYVLDAGVLVEIEGGVATPLVHAADVPATLSGTSAPHIANALAMLAASRALGLSPAAAVRALTSFERRNERELAQVSMQAHDDLASVASAQWPRASVKLAG